MGPGYPGMKVGRREFIGRSGACLLGAAAGSVLGSPPRPRSVRSGPVRGRPGRTRVRAPAAGPRRLPRSSRRLLLQDHLLAGTRMNDGFIVPSLADGMAAFPGPAGSTVILRNHEFRFGHAASLGPFGSEEEALDQARPEPDLRPDPRRGALPRLGHDDRLRHAADKDEEPAPQPGRNDDQLLGRGDALGDMAVERGGLRQPGRPLPGAARVHLRGRRVGGAEGHGPRPLDGHGPLRQGGRGRRPQDRGPLSDRGPARRAVLPVPPGRRRPAGRRGEAPGPGRDRNARARDEQLAGPEDRAGHVLRGPLDRPRRSRPRRRRSAVPGPRKGGGGFRVERGHRPSRRGGLVRLHQRRNGSERADLALRSEPDEGAAPAA